jgi:hypothetical protein
VLGTSRAGTGTATGSAKPPGIEEDRAASKSPHLTFGYFLSISQHEVTADIIQNSAVGNFSPKTEGTKTKAAGCLFFLMSFPFL